MAESDRGKGRVHKQPIRWYNKPLQNHSISSLTTAIMSAEKYTVSEKRYVEIKKDEIRLFEVGTKKSAKFSYSRWAQLVMHMDEIDNAVSKLDNEEEKVKLELHCGGV